MIQIQNGMNVVEIKNLSKKFRDILAVDGVSFTVKEGEVFGLLGPNGSGKTTLIRCLLGLLRPTGGSATIFGHDIVNETFEIRKRCSLLPQEGNCVETLTARENILYQGGIHSGDVVGNVELQKRTDKLIELIDLEDRQNDLVKKFSGGMKRRVLIASTLIMYPDLIFLDEPTTAIDIVGARTIRTLIKDLSSQKKTIFLTTHDLTDINELCDRVGVIVGGRMLAVGRPVELTEKFNVQGIEAVYTGLVKGKLVAS
ncbi:MAG: ABC transporter ATP-binding protein [Candidatus Hodarchaeota archaeon]